MDSGYGGIQKVTLTQQQLLINGLSLESGSKEMGWNEGSLERNGKIEKNVNQM